MKCSKPENLKVPDVPFEPYYRAVSYQGYGGPLWHNTPVSDTFRSCVREALKFLAKTRYSDGRQSDMLFIVEIFYYPEENTNYCVYSFKCRPKQAETGHFWRADDFYEKTDNQLHWNLLKEHNHEKE